MGVFVPFSEWVFKEDLMGMLKVTNSPPNYIILC